ncbi:hypothetical protein O9G_003172 [Rozella allomycis CSF55]|uniref:GCF C-terminal domain-containing protein n=1 Tax=Rozella allomycis (strain CSF55) TaxID=988480 RepID=A0A075AZK4_ROZAC|nr:hypothetical protein O9G_003172 [Rozella allomycis CSF55]|eukprot:EPZ34092.1 hypothetical protein O9G_003172 [Rozella allomycis CSF55]
MFTKRSKRGNIRKKNVSDDEEEVVVNSRAGTGQQKMKVSFDVQDEIPTTSFKMKRNEIVNLPETDRDDSKDDKTSEYYKEILLQRKQNATMKTKSSIPDSQDILMAKKNREFKRSLNEEFISLNGDVQYGVQDNTLNAYEENEFYDEEMSEDETREEWELSQIRKGVDNTKINAEELIKSKREEISLQFDEIANFDDFIKETELNIQSFRRELKEEKIKLNNLEDSIKFINDYSLNLQKQVTQEAEEYEFMQKLRNYFITLCDFFEEKSFKIEKAFSSLNSLMNNISPSSIEETNSTLKIQPEFISSIVKNVDEQFSSPTGFLKLLKEFKTNYPKKYESAYFSHNIPGLMEFYIKYELLSLNPLMTYKPIDSMAWYSHLFQFCSSSSDDYEQTLIPICIRKYVIPWFQLWLKAFWPNEVTYRHNFTEYFENNDRLFREIVNTVKAKCLEVSSIEDSLSILLNKLTT